MTEFITTRTVQLGLAAVDHSRDSGPRASLVFQMGDRAEVVQLTGKHDSVIVGRVAPADVVLPGSALSRQHARFSWRKGQLSVEDLESLNGTWVNGDRVEQKALGRGDQVQLGELTVHISMSTPDRQPPHAQAAKEPVVGEAMAALYERIERLAQIDVSVLIEGETGTGKELCARALHERGPRRDAPLSVLNCGAIPDGLAESALFGHERGAFTGATSRSKGIFEQAGNGTVFLDEIGELPVATQAKLLRVLETRRVTRLGADHDIAVPVRVISATHCNLSEMVEAGSFRRDLLYRLNAITLRVPPLRERKDEIEPLVEHFRRRAEQEWSLPACRFEAAALEAMGAFPWPGNVRQLRNVVERGVLLCRGGVVGLEDLPPSIAHPQPTAWAPGGTLSAEAQPGAAVVPHTAGEKNGEEDAVDNGDKASAHGDTLRAQVDALEARLIESALRDTDGNQRAAAKLLGVPRRTLAYKIQRLGIDPKPTGGGTA